MKHTQRGAAILTALLLVTLVATLSTSALWQQWRALEVETAERTKVQSRWLLQGALDWARLILREDARNAAPDHLGEPWAVVLQEAQLSSFLAGSGSAADLGEHLKAAYLSGQITDLQARLNLLNLVQEGQIHQPSLRAFSRLFEALQLPPAELAFLVAQLQLTLQATQAESATEGPHPLLPRNIEQLAWLGLTPATLAALQAHAVVLPERTPVNLNTASALVLHASLPGLDLAAAERMVQARKQSHFRTLSDAVQASGVPDLAVNSGQHSVGSRYFEVRVRLRLGSAVSQERSMLRREGLQVKTLATLRETPPLASVQ
ncbi:MAG: general secretion pathway protein GspK [Curvibacter sp. RIFCSPHIGHO2_12_FULL_63_18]|uniref:type II secretion system minor pseudopilin GspK n=1 Tax=Rhodoferax sp. TaxID=50421 RepID=UPI0008D0B6D9|nr:type II secretion system minor pseudopilin GspK [Rhodoferax sp.]OGO95975.1 MAG: general secretion pathway protein GspK [Curvibacter sp. GWA2_63_95]OGP06643.1 MAG: general secretion pathway protein GspK [Curvibacter sp. RIFCSPHIGHO2_12_FULL_63_18]HCX81344.1 general secretion pathway protein GspK [Rhodoferax sp.]